VAGVDLQPGDAARALDEMRRSGAVEGDRLSPPARHDRNPTDSTPL
jgi:hypothetical protein